MATWLGIDNRRPAMPSDPELSTSRQDPVARLRALHERASPQPWAAKQYGADGAWGIEPYVTSGCMIAADAQLAAVAARVVVALGEALYSIGCPFEKSLAPCSNEHCLRCRPLVDLAAALADVGA